jgi:hypothetical protein
MVAIADAIIRIHANDTVSPIAFVFCCFPPISPTFLEISSLHAAPFSMVPISF